MTSCRDPIPINDIAKKIRCPIAINGMSKKKRRMHNFIKLEATHLNLVVDVYIQKNALVLDKLLTENYYSEYVIDVVNV